MADDDKKVPIRLYEQRMRFTPNGTQFSNQVTKEGRDLFKRLEAEQIARISTPEAKTTRQKFNERVTMPAKATSKTKFKRAAKKDRDDFER